MQAPALRLSFRQLLAILLAQCLALSLQAWLSRFLVARGHEELLAHYLAYLAVPPILLIALAPVLIEYRGFLLQLFSPPGLTVRTALAALALGVTMRIAWWAQLIARVSLGIGVADSARPAVGPAFAWACPPAPTLFLGALVMVVLIPLAEETLHRGLLQSTVMHKGPLHAVLISAAIFTVFHPPSSYWFVFLLGIVLGTQFWLTGTLWTTIISHSVYNGLIQFDWRCLRGHWNPPRESLPLPGVAALALAALAFALLLVVALLFYQRAGARNAPATAATGTRSPRAR